MREVWIIDRLRDVVFESEEVANAFIDKFRPEWDEKDYNLICVRLISHIDDV